MTVESNAEYMGIKYRLKTLTELVPITSFKESHYLHAQFKKGCTSNFLCIKKNCILTKTTHEGA